MATKLTFCLAWCAAAGLDIPEVCSTDVPAKKKGDPGSVHVVGLYEAGPAKANISGW